ncbi:MAG: DUF6279 family lipoprotein [Gammaproteobacteria bacterium]
MATVAALTMSCAKPRAKGVPGRISRLFGLLLLAIMLGGCISTRFVFNQLDWVITWRLNSYFSLEEEQEKLLRKTVGSSLEWLRTEQLPVYADLLRSIAADAQARQLSTERLGAVFQQVIELYDAFLRQIMPDVVTFLSSLSDEQVEYLIEKLAEENEELDEEYSGRTVKERLARREKAAIKNFQRFTGRLKADQRLIISNSIAGMYDNSEEWLAGRRAWQQDFRRLLLERPPSPVFQARLLSISLDPNYMDSADYRKQVEANQLTVLTLMVDVIASLDDKQMARFTRRINDFAGDFDALAAQQAKP